MELQTLLSVSSVEVQIERTNPSLLVISATGDATMPGFTGVLLDPVTYVAPPEDGIYEFMLTGTPPAEATTEVISPVSSEDFRWEGFPAELKGIRVTSLENSIEAFPDEEIKYSQAEEDEETED